MNTEIILQAKSQSLKETENLAEKMGTQLRGGEVIALNSDLGGGKTAFVRGLVKGFGSSDHVASPTFTLSRQYTSPSKNLTMYHFDFYRLNSPGIMAAELSEILQTSDAVTVVEWGAIVSGVMPTDHINITIEHISETARLFTIIYPPKMDYLFKDITI